MPAIVLVGAQWGDEGKGKATDLMGSEVDYVVKFNGGNNAGHTVVVGDERTFRVARLLVEHALLAALAIIIEVLAGLAELGARAENLLEVAVVVLDRLGHDEQKGMRAAVRQQSTAKAARCL